LGLGLGGVGVGVDASVVVDVVDVVDCDWFDKFVGLGVRGRRWHSVQPSRNRVTASRGRNAYVSVICNREGGSRW